MNKYDAYFCQLHQVNAILSQIIGEMKKKKKDGKEVVEEVAKGKREKNGKWE